MSDIIYAHVYNPEGPSLFKTPANTKAQVNLVHCDNKDNCALYAKGQCVQIGINYHNCPYGKRSYVYGYSKRARNFYSWMSKQEEIYKDSLDKITSAPKMLAVVGEYVYLPYDFMDMNPFLNIKERRQTFSSYKASPFIKLEEFTLETIISICKFRPQAIFGGEIKDYQKEEVPKFLNHLSDKFPDLFEELCEAYPPAKMFKEKKTYVGRKAQLFSLNPNIGSYVDIHGSSWTWDGEWLTSYNSRAAHMLTSNFSELKIKPSKDVVVTITDNAQVNENTIFVS